MKSIPYHDLSPGTILVASPDIEVEYLKKKVILLCENKTEGSFGLILNQPYLAPQNREQIPIPDLDLRIGGIINPEQVFIIYQDEQVHPHSVEIAPKIYLSNDLSFLTKKTERPPSLILFFGYIAWGHEELQQEFLSHLWFPFPSSKIDLFSKNIDNLWRSSLQHISGDFSYLSKMPDDVSLN